MTEVPKKTRKPIDRTKPVTPIVSSFAEAEATYAARTPWRGDKDGNTRALSERNRNRFRQIRRVDADTYELLLSGDPVMTYRRDGTLTLKLPRAQVGQMPITESFVQSSLGNWNDAPTVIALGAMQCYTLALGTGGIWRGEGRTFYYMSDEVVLVRDADNAWQPRDTPPPFTKPVAKRKAAKKIYDEYGITDFSAWAAARERLSDVNVGRSISYRVPSGMELLALVRDREAGWPKLFEMHKTVPDPAQRWARNRDIVTHLQKAAARLHKTFEMVEIASCKNFNEVRAIEAAWRKYQPTL